MCSWHSSTTVPSSPADIIELLTEPNAIARWTPVPFEVVALDGERLESGSHARVAGRLAGRAVEFDVNVVRACDHMLELVAHGPISIDVAYRLRPAGRGSEIEASVSVQGQGLVGRVLARATDTLLAGGALRLALERLAHELQPAVAA